MGSRRRKGTSSSRGGSSRFLGYDKVGLAFLLQNDAVEVLLISGQASWGN
jgi:hypothetical protein